MIGAHSLRRAQPGVASEAGRPGCAVVDGILVANIASDFCRDAIKFLQGTREIGDAARFPRQRVSSAFLARPDSPASVLKRSPMEYTTGPPRS